MSEADVSGVAAEHGVVSSQSSLTAGQMMRSAREAAGLHVAALAVSMKIPVKKLEALEADRLDQLHDAVFVRALASSVCRTLKIDPVPVLDRLPMNAAPRLNPDERGINAPFHTPGETVGASVSAMLSRPPVLIVVALLAAAAAVVFFPDIKLAERAVESPSTATKSESVAASPLVDPAPPAPVEAVPAPVEQVEQSREAVSAPVVPPTAAVVSSQPVSSPQPVIAKPAASAPVVTASAPASSPSRTASAPVTPTTGLVVFRARAASWVKVVDAKGVVQLSKTLAEGEVAGASGATPLSVIVGRVDMTDVEVRGQSFSMTAVARENVARFEVK